ncbi:hypothetical protein [Tepidibacter mesophilus]|uniref:hypothetical protein n=1 Tax=Tepidibacter mesophilus TaxID=655607 RepID=UPI001651488B|nr:hypothetical protein [Tepidibacter mesophilus]
MSSWEMNLMLIMFMWPVILFMVVYIHHYMKFKLGNGEEKEFEVLPKQYAVILESNIGELTFKGDKYLGIILSLTFNTENRRTFHNRTYEKCIFNNLYNHSNSKNV